MKNQHDQPIAADALQPEREATFAAPHGSASPTDAEITDLKVRLNQIIWEYAPAETTIGDAEDLACKILNAVRAGKYLR